MRWEFCDLVLMTKQVAVSVNFFIWLSAANYVLANFSSSKWWLRWKEKLFHQASSSKPFVTLHLNDPLMRVGKHQTTGVFFVFYSSSPVFMTSCTLGLMKERDLVLKMRERSMTILVKRGVMDGSTVKWFLIIFLLHRAVARWLHVSTFVHELLTQKAKLIEVDGGNWKEFSFANF